jgi:16S rRNA (cytosine967-C5)-methyltransferase
MSSKAPNVANETRLPAHGLSARTVALNLFQEVQTQRLSLDDVIADSKAFRQLETRDRGFVRHLLSSTLRHLGQIDTLIKHCLDRPLPQRAAAVRAILRLGITQIVILKTPAHAVVDTAVRLCVQSRQPGQKGLVNAVLRRLSREGPALFEAQDSARLNTPNWLWESWSAAYGEETCRGIALAHLSEPPLDLTVKNDPAGWAETLGGSVLAGNTVRLDASKDVTALAGYDEGAWWVQDVAASMPARILLSGLGGELENLTCIDLCAAPGGKTAQLAAAGLKVTAVDRSPRRLARLRKNLQRLALDAEIVSADVAAWRPASPVGAILLDAPCSATGTIRRHPDIPGNKNQKEIARLGELQEQLILAAADMLAPGGVLVYSVCSLQPEEGPEIVDKLLSQREDLSRQEILISEIGLPPDALTPAGDMRTFPSHFAANGGMDGFYIARLKRRG